MNSMVYTSAKTTVSPSVATVSVQLIGTNDSRRFFMLYNNSANSCYINFNQAASSNTCSVIIPTFATWSWPSSVAFYTGPVTAIRNAGTGTIIVTEFLNAYP